MSLRGGIAFLVIALGAPLSACEAVVGDLGSYTDKCSPVDDRCPKSSPCTYDFGQKAFKCSPRKGTKQEDNTCDNETDCVGGHSCSQFPNNTVAHCARYCLGNSDCPTNNCYSFENKRVLASGDPVGACGPLDPACDPLGATSSCGKGKRCHFFDTDYTKCVLLSSPAVMVGETCLYLNDCTPGSTCFGSDSAGYTCTQLCDFDNANCPGTTTCQEYPGASRNLGSLHIGLCLP